MKATNHIKIFILSIPLLFISTLGQTGNAVDCKALTSSAESLLLANIESVKSGSCTFQVVEIRNKMDVFGSQSSQDISGEGKKIGSIPSIQTAENITLSGKGWYKWSGNYLAYFNDIPTIPVPPEGSQDIKVLSAWGLTTFADGEVKNLEGLKPLLPLGESTAGPAKEVSLTGTIRKDPNGDSLTEPRFNEIVLFTAARKGFDPHLSEWVKNCKMTEEGLLAVTSFSNPDQPAITYYLDPARAYMPVKTERRLGGSLLISVKETRYEKIGECWFPVSSILRQMNKDGEEWLTCRMTLISHEFGKAYPQSDFDIVFPAQAVVKDER